MRFAGDDVHSRMSPHARMHDRRHLHEHRHSGGGALGPQDMAATLRELSTEEATLERIAAARDIAGGDGATLLQLSDSMVRHGSRAAGEHHRVHRNRRIRGHVPAHAGADTAPAPSPDVDPGAGAEAGAVPEDVRFAVTAAEAGSGSSTEPVYSREGYESPSLAQAMDVTPRNFDLLMRECSRTWEWLKHSATARMYAQYLDMLGPFPWDAELACMCVPCVLQSRVVVVRFLTSVVVVCCCLLLSVVVCCCLLLFFVCSRTQVRRQVPVRQHRRLWRALCVSAAHGASSRCGFPVFRFAAPAVAAKGEGEGEG